MRPVEKIRRLSAALRPEHLTAVVDIGANPFVGVPPYRLLRRSDCCTLVGFEPQPEALKALVAEARHNDHFLPYAIGDGTRKPLYVTRNSGLVSTLKPIPRITRLLGPWWRRAIQIQSTLEMETHRLDDVKEVTRIDFLKIDIQGGELDVFRHARQKLKGCAAIQTEICLHPYYENQPSFGDIQAELADQGFIAHKFVEMSAHPVGNTLDRGKEAPKHRNQVTGADLVFIKDPTAFTENDIETIKQLAILSFAVFKSYDLTLRCLSDLRDFGALTDAEVQGVIRTLDI